MSITVSTFSTLIHIMSLVGLRMLKVIWVSTNTPMSFTQLKYTPLIQTNCIYPQPNSVPCE